MMNKQAAGLIAVAGIAVGMVGMQVAHALGEARTVTAHAWDVRARALPDGGTEYRVEAWFSQKLSDGGTKDLGPGKRCELAAEQLAAQAETLLDCAPK